MDELAKKLASLGGAVVPAWNDERSERLLAGVSRLRTRRRRQRVAVSVASVALCLLGGFAAVQLDGGPQIARLNRSGSSVEPRGLQEPGPQLLGRQSLAVAPKKGAASEPTPQLPLQLADGSRVHALSRGAAVVVQRNEAERIALRVDVGGARFDVIPNTKREFIVQAGGVEVSVLGTIFDVEREDGRVRVSVTRGKVRVRSSLRNTAPTILMPGESAWFDDDESVQPTAANAAAAQRVSAEESAEIAAREAAATAAERGEWKRERAAGKAHGRSARHGASTRSEAPRAAWRSLSQSGDYEGAYRLLVQETAVEDESGALLDAADAARLSGHPEAAVQYLRKVVDRHRHTPVAPLAAFTLGRVLLERLGQPSEAAEAFATARQLAPHGSLAQDALAREVEAWSKAGHPDEAYERAREYIESYPQGRRLRSVQLYGGIQVP